MRRKRLGEDGFITEINVTPFVDVLLILVVIFLVTLPLVKTSNLAVNLPRAALNNDAPMAAPAVIVVKKNGDFLIDNKKAEPPALVAVLKDKQQKGLLSTVVIQSDKDVNYGRVVELIAYLKNNGFEKIGLTVEKPRT